jgi:cell fate regulator YaaT (PSP1 superfamily)
MVLCRTERGTEVGQVLACEPGGPQCDAAGDVLRALTASDERQLWDIHARQVQAVELAESLFKRRRITAALVDAELLFDRQQFCFYVLGNLGPDFTELVESLREELAAGVQFVALEAAESSKCGGSCGCGSRDSDDEGRADEDRSGEGRSAGGGGGCGPNRCESCPASEGCGRK